jgi:hypothetical protein
MLKKFALIALVAASMATGQVSADVLGAGAQDAANEMLHATTPRFPQLQGKKDKNDKNKADKADKDKADKDKVDKDKGDKDKADKDKADKDKADKDKADKNSDKDKDKSDKDKVNYDDCDGSIYLSKQNSRTKCKPGKNFGMLDSETMWVNQGCRGVFHRGAGEQTVECSSWSYKYATCSMPDWGPESACGEPIEESDSGSGQSGDSELILTKQLSRSECIRGSSFGLKDAESGKMFVQAGCRGKFSFDAHEFQCSSHRYQYAECTFDVKKKIYKRYINFSFWSWYTVTSDWAAGLVGDVSDYVGTNCKCSNQKSYKGGKKKLALASAEEDAEEEQYLNVYTIEIEAYEEADLDEMVIALQTCEDCEAFAYISVAESVEETDEEESSSKDNSEVLTIALAVAATVVVCLAVVLLYRQRTLKAHMRVASQASFGDSFDDTQQIEIGEALPTVGVITQEA